MWTSSYSHPEEKEPNAWPVRLGGQVRQYLHLGLCDDYLQLLICPLQELNLLIVLLLLHLSPLTLPFFGGFTFCLLLVHLPLQISFFCF